MQIKVNTTLFDRYKGDTDPQNHLAKYNSYMMSVWASDATMCLLFPLTLSEQAHKLFTSLTSYSVNSFEQLGKIFMGHFVAMEP